MKKIIAFILVLSSVLCIFSVDAFALDALDVSENMISKDSVLEDILSKEKILKQVTGIYDSEASEMSTKSSGLILATSLWLSETSTQLLITGKTYGETDVTKCGFTYIKLQRLMNGYWTDYVIYYDQYSNSPTKIFSKYVTPPKGYTYRVVCEHYAERPYLVIFTQSETRYNVTSALVF